MRGCVFGLLLWAPLLAFAIDQPLQLAIRSGGGDTLFSLSTEKLQSQKPLPDSLFTPLGSLWKLYVYAWLEDNQQPERPYQCSGEENEEVYCCNAGESIMRDKALVRSCGLYFSPQRLGINPHAWQQYWQTRKAPHWLQQLASLQPQTRVPVHQLLQTLEQLPAQQKARTVLLDVVLDASKQSLAGAFGSRLRVKTWSWFADNDPQSRQGGFAGWLSDGTVLWAQGQGTSKTVLDQHAAVLNTVLPLTSTGEGGECVVVDLFSRYPLKQINDRQGAVVENTGQLNGRYKVAFANGNHQGLTSHGELYLERSKQGWHLIARLNREEYVARVLEREAKSEPLEAAKAMAVAIRTYLLQSAERGTDCLRITDSSATQRVSASPAGKEAKAIAAWTQDLVLAGVDVNYHLHRATKNTLAWSEAVEQANKGMRYDAILAAAFPQASMSRWNNPQASCQPIARAELWIKSQQPHWRMRLNNEPGYDELNRFAVCRLPAGYPFVDRTQKRLYIRNFFTLQDRLDLTHEYLHLAFDGYPSGMDEQYIENLTRHLLMD